MVDLFGKDIFHILDEYEQFPIGIVLETIMHRYPELKEVGE